MGSVKQQATVLRDKHPFGPCTSVDELFGAFHYHVKVLVESAEGAVELFVAFHHDPKHPSYAFVYDFEGEDVPNAQGCGC